MTIHNPNGELPRQAQAARDLLAAHKDIIAGDDDFAMDVVEGQTDFVEIVNALIAQDGEDAAQIEAIQSYIDKIQARGLRINARIEKRRNALLMALQMAGLKTLRCALGSVGLRDTPPKAVPTDEALIPAEFWKADPKLDRRAVLAALNDGRDVPGAVLSNGGVSLTIRRN